MEDLREAFSVLCLKLNPTKCAFKVQLGKFMGFLVLKRGIKADPEKLRAIIEMQLPTNLNEVQKLVGNIAVLNRFMSKSTDKCLPFFQVLKKAQGWDSRCEEAFTQLKEYLTHSPLLSQTK